MASIRACRARDLGSSPSRGVGPVTQLVVKSAFSRLAKSARLLSPLPDKSMYSASA